MADNYLHERGDGKWIIAIYSPEKQIGPFLGSLKIGKDFHVVENKSGGVLVSIPSQNVAFCVNKDLAVDIEENVV